LKRAIKELQTDPKIGKVIPHDDGARKLRLANSSANKGKSGGFRLIYYVQELPKPILWFLLVYSKNEQEDVGSSELEKLVAAIKLS
jgi:mRNA-degrading endonuclease RelE of RelBE toxin-antitoxin system